MGFKKLSFNSLIKLETENSKLRIALKREQASLEKVRNIVVLRGERRSITPFI
jgi:hypothetical protein